MNKKNFMPEERMDRTVNYLEKIAIKDEELRMLTDVNKNETDDLFGLNPDETRLKKRLNEITDVLEAMTVMDFSKRLPIDGKIRDPFHFIAGALNTLNELLEEFSVPKALLDAYEQAVSDIVFTTDQKNIISSINSNACRILGFKKETLAGKPLRTLFPELPELSPLDKPKQIKTLLTDSNNRKIEVSLSRSAIIRNDDELIGYIYACSVTAIKNETDDITKNTDLLARCYATVAYYAHRALFLNDPKYASLKEMFEVIDQFLQLQELEKLKEKLEVSFWTAQEKIKRAVKKLESSATKKKYDQWVQHNSPLMLFSKEQFTGMKSMFSYMAINNCIDLLENFRSQSVHHTRNKLLASSVDILDLSQPTLRALRKLKIHHIEDFLKIPEKNNLNALRGISKKMEDEIRNALEQVDCLYVLKE